MFPLAAPLGVQEVPSLDDVGEPAHPCSDWASAWGLRGEGVMLMWPVNTNALPTTDEYVSGGLMKPGV
jgi:hypothetical protein